MSRVSTMPIATTPASAVTPAKIQSATVSTSIALCALGLDAERLHLKGHLVSPELARGRNNTRRVGLPSDGLDAQDVGVETPRPLVLLVECRGQEGDAAGRGADPEVERAPDDPDDSQPHVRTGGILETAHREEPV